MAAFYIALGLGILATIYFIYTRVKREEYLAYKQKQRQAFCLY
jgi:hypothetical protein